MVSLFLTDEELGKKDDDHKPARLPLRSRLWSPAQMTTRKNAKRLIIALIIGLGVYLFIRNIPTDVPIRDRRRPFYEQTDEALPFQRPPESAKSTPQPESLHEPEKSIDRNYNGQVRFPSLSASLYAISSTRGGHANNKNVLFAASSLKSVTTLLPIACQMASELRSYVHFVLMSRSAIDIDDLRAINGVDESCHVIFHGMLILPGRWSPVWSAAAGAGLSLD